MEKLHLSWLETIFYEKNIHIFFNKQPSYYGSNVKNGLKVKQLAKQHPTLKTLMQKTLVGLWVKNFNVFNFKFTKAKFLHISFWHNLIA